MIWSVRVGCVFVVVTSAFRPELLEPVRLRRDASLFGLNTEDTQQVEINSGYTRVLGASTGRPPSHIMKLFLLLPPPEIINFWSLCPNMWSDLFVNGTTGIAQHLRESSPQCDVVHRPSRLVVLLSCRDPTWNDRDRQPWLCSCSWRKHELILLTSLWTMWVHLWAGV